MHPQFNETLFDNLNLAWMLIKRDLKNRYASSYAGMAWNIGVPLLNAIIYVIVFSILMKGRMGSYYSDIPFALFYFVPFSLWTVFADVVGRSPAILKEYGYLITKIAFPSWVLPLVPLGSALLSQAIILAIIFGLLVYLGIPLANTAGIYILVWLITLVMTLGFAYAVSSLSVYLPDLAQIVPIGITILFWMTPILYPATLVEEHGALLARSIIMDFNPFYYIVESSRHAVFGSAVVSWQVLSMVGVVAILIFAFGYFIFRKLQPGFADVI